MDTALFFLAWYAVGVVGSVVIFELWWRRNGLDIEVGDILFGAGTALMGPINLIIAVIFGAVWLLSRTFNLKSVVFRAKESA